MLIAIVEDNRGLANAINDVLVDAGHGVDMFHNGDDADQYLESEEVNLVILDLGLPGMSGLELLKRMRARGDKTPVLVLTARKETKDTIDGLNAGADDYVGKPFEMDELVARVGALLRRSEKFVDVEQIGSIEFDRGSRSLNASGHPLDLPRKELAVFECLANSRGRLVSKEALLSFVYGSGSDVSETAIEVYVSRLRRRLEPHGVLIKAARGIGYRLEC